MKKTFNLVKVNSKYCNYLRKYDYRVSFNGNKKKLRPFVGILFEIGKLKYFAPLSSPKLKHLNMKNSIDFYKIDGGKLGAINLNNMIPIPETEYSRVNIHTKNLTKAEEKYKELLKDQLRWINRKGQILRKKAITLYNKRITNKLPKEICDRCCDFLLLEEKCKEYIKKQRIHT